MKTLSIFGATGSIGDSTLDVIRQHRDKFQIKGLVAGRNVEKLAALALEFNPETVIVSDETVYLELKELLTDWNGQVASGSAAVNDLAAASQDLVVSAITGISGLPSTFAALGAGNTVALANKESLVCAGSIMIDLAKANSAQILPLDSEHSAIFQCLNGEKRDQLETITLTASGGPFRGKTRKDLAGVTVAQALDHPNWSMGPKVTIDSASLANKGLEYIEAAYLFGVKTSELDVIVHPQSIVHSYVTFTDGSTIAQLGVPDMRTPIATALAFPNRIPLKQDTMDLAAIGQLTFQAVDHETFPALSLAMQAFEAGPVAPVVFNAANEVAVEAFLAGQIEFLDISDRIKTAMDQDFGKSIDSIEAVWAIDAAVRRSAPKI